MALTAKQQRFVDEYLVDLNATQAAIRAGYSERTARAIGQENLTKPDIEAAIQAALRDRQARTEITQDTVVEELTKIGLAEAHDYSDADLKYSNKLRALELLGKHLGMFDGKGGQDVEKRNNLLDAVKRSAEEDVDTDDLPEVQ